MIGRLLFALVVSTILCLGFWRLQKRWPILFDIASWGMIALFSFLTGAVIVMTIQGDGEWWMLTYISVPFIIANQVWLLRRRRRERAASSAPKLTGQDDGE